SVCARHTIGRPPSPPESGRPFTHRTEVAGGPAPVAHLVPSRRAETSRGSTARSVQIQIAKTVARSYRGQQLRAPCMPARPVLVEAAGVLYFEAASAYRPARTIPPHHLSEGAPLMNSQRLLNPHDDLHNDLAVMKFGIGQPVLRTEDPILVRGAGCYTDDIKLPGEAHAVMVRSRIAHGTIKHIDTSAARTMPGVLGVYTGADLAEYGTLKCIVPFNNRD